jgi:hypothetical protein
MTIKDVILQNKDGIADFEIYESVGRGEHFPNHFHTDSCKPADFPDLDQERDRILYAVMDEEEYNDTLLANTCIEADFAEWYNNKDAKVLVIMVEPD